MDLQTFTAFLNEYTLDVLVLGVIISLLTGLIKKIIPDKIKSLVSIIPFLLGILLYGLYSYFLLNLFEVYSVITKGFQCGGVATLCYAFFKQILSSSGSVKQAVQNVLKGVLSTSVIKEISTAISKKFSVTESDEETEMNVRKILSESADIPKEISWAMAKIIAVTLSKKKK